MIAMATITGNSNMAAKTGNIYIPGGTTHSVEIPRKNSGFARMVSSVKVSASDCDDNRQPGIARLVPKQRA